MGNHRDAGLPGNLCLGCMPPYRERGFHGGMRQLQTGGAKRRAQLSSRSSPVRKSWIASVRLWSFRLGALRAWPSSVCERLSLQAETAFRSTAAPCPSLLFGPGSHASRDGEPQGRDAIRTREGKRRLVAFQCVRLGLGGYSGVPAPTTQRRCTRCVRVQSLVDLALRGPSLDFTVPYNATALVPTSQSGAL